MTLLSWKRPWQRVTPRWPIWRSLLSLLPATRRYRRGIWFPMSFGIMITALVSFTLLKYYKRIIRVLRWKLKQKSVLEFICRLRDYELLCMYKLYICHSICMFNTPNTIPLRHDARKIWRGGGYQWSLRRNQMLQRLEPANDSLRSSTGNTWRCPKTAPR